MSEDSFEFALDGFGERTRQCSCELEQRASRPNPDGGTGMGPSP